MEFDWLALQKRAHEEFAARIAAISDWEAPTPDDEWSVRDLVSHVVDEQRWVPHLLSGMTVVAARGRLVPLGLDLEAEWHRYSRSATEAWHSTPLHQEVHLSYDTVTVADYLREQVSDVTIHTWDLARANGRDEQLDPALVEAAWSIFEPQKETLQASGLFASPVPVPDDAPLQTRLLALTGRDERTPLR
ncbi:TIGR03086 family metal-binding protein [Desertivibrio insolitus]|uniref:TIGR03086 family metal-binding protein n=1 Tax=Herbiconiux sp. SYSU D00978 TaxID=2812562 RepID=UPI001A961FD8|nr:TIGR03086 family metal-binding protein [Herbiconiux sp. SYSU D00978]